MDGYLHDPVELDAAARGLRRYGTELDIAHAEIATAARSTPWEGPLASEFRAALAGLAREHADDIAELHRIAGTLDAAAAAAATLRAGGAG